MSNMEFVVLVDPTDQPIGKMEKMEAHEKGVLHRAFSAFVFNHKHELMLQQRAFSKYHSPGLWTNTCCSHPRENEAPIEAAHRRMVEEMGFDCEVEPAFQFTYKADVGQGLTEHEFDHVFIGYSEAEPEINEEEVNSWKYMSMEAIREDMSQNPENYTVWFRIAFEEVDEFLKRVTIKE
ncbi:MAG: isopentenyl-diphosphate Delta-isomerase [Bacteroidales bacterium]|nr:isopentenyl-diphosphate Delta-isomerase [Bacteroidales bacterium]